MGMAREWMPSEANDSMILINVLKGKTLRNMARGGKRVGAGRPPGTGKYGEPTKAMRLPVSLADQLSEVLATWGRSRFEDIVPQLQRVRRKPEASNGLPLYSQAVAAGFQDSTSDEIEQELDFNGYLTTHPDASFCVRATGELMLEAGIQGGDLLVVDTLGEPEDGDLVMAVVETQLMVKRLGRQGDRLLLLSEKPQQPPLVLSPEREFYILGRVTHSIHAF